MKKLTAKTVFFEFEEINDSNEIVSTCQFVLSSDDSHCFVRMYKSSNEAEISVFRSYEEMMRFKKEAFDIFEIQ